MASQKGNFSSNDFEVALRRMVDGEPAPLISADLVFNKHV